MRYILAIVFLLVSSSLSAEEWTPPKNPSPGKILTEARNDADAKNYETALAKHVWFHEHALEISPSYRGVRLSFALSYWVELAKNYPPALKQLKEIRDEAQANVLAGKNISSSFHDLEAINGHLDEHAKTKEFFEVLDKQHPEMAKNVFALAQPSLIRSKSYALINKYLSPREDFAKIKRGFLQAKQLAKGGGVSPMFLEFVQKKFSHDSATLVAILAVNDRQEEAGYIATAARVEWEDEEFHEALRKALKGVVPDPWP